MPNEASSKFKIRQEDHDALVDQMSDTFATWTSIVDEIDDTNLKAQLDSVIRSMIKHTVIMEMDLEWARMILESCQQQEGLHPGLDTQIKGFLNAYELKYISAELLDET